MCKACSGAGNISRSMRKSSDGKYLKKANKKSYPSFIAIGPMPVGDRGLPHLLEKEHEDLCYLVGNWKIFQNIGRHRYSTDDLVTSYVACKEAQRLGLDVSRPHFVLDMGCGLGSVLLTNAWQLPNAVCIGLEAQTDRYTQALRSIEYNVGNFPVEQTRIRIYNTDIRYPSEGILSSEELKSGFDLITGTPPYFPTRLGAFPGCMESAGCLFELRGGVEVYCEAASRFLRPPGCKKRAESASSSSDNDDNNNDYEYPSVFVMCNTSLASSRVYLSCQTNSLSVIKRCDVVPLAGKLPLFSVFTIVLDAWIRHSPDLFPHLLPPASLPIDLPTDPNKAVRITSSLRGETVHQICVRESGSLHSVEYQALLRDLGKPCSADRELYTVVT